MIKKISDKDKKDWENFLSSNEPLQDKDREQKKNFKKKTLSFDLHGFSLSDANKKINELIINSYDSGISKLIIVTGKGIHHKMKKTLMFQKILVS